MPAIGSKKGARSEHFTLVYPLRFLASYAVTWHHVAGGMFLGVGFGVFLFLLVLVALAAIVSKPEPFGSFARRKADYLLSPWVRWSIFYGLLYVVGDAVDPDRTAFGRFNGWMVLYGTRIELWFLPSPCCCSSWCERSSPRCVASHPGPPSARSR